jgi:pyruvate/2-oxoglutarate dehydrogenase complex dihydrolipoamide dehydrogenase (E3) component
MEKKNPDDDKEQIKVTYLREDTKQHIVEYFDTVLFATGRDPQTKDVGLEKVGVELNKEGKLFVNDYEQTRIPSIYAIGDCIVDRPELTPVAIQAGLLLARRLYGRSQQKMDYNFIPTTIFTPYEYGAVGMSDETAMRLLGRQNVDCYISRYGVLEVTAAHPGPKKPIRSHQFHKEKDEEGNPTAERILAQPCVAKLVVDKSRNERVVGFHYIGPNAGEMTQGFALAVKLGATKADFDNLVGIHPTGAEEFTSLKIKMSSGADYRKKDGC